MRTTALKRVLALVAAVALAVVPALGLAGCGPSAQEQVTEKVTQDFDEIKDLNAQTIDKYMDSAMTADLEKYGVTADQVVQAFYQHFSYTIDEVTVDGDTAVAKVTTTNVDLTQVMQQWLTEFTTWAQSDEGAQAYTDGGEDAIAKEGVKQLLDLMNAADVATCTGTTELTLVKQDGEWDYSSESEVAQALMAGQDLGSLAGSL